MGRHDELMDIDQTTQRIRHDWLNWRVRNMGKNREAQTEIFNAWLSALERRVYVNTKKRIYFRMYSTAAFPAYFATPRGRNIHLEKEYKDDKSTAYCGETVKYNLVTAWRGNETIPYFNCKKCMRIYEKEIMQ